MIIGFGIGEKGVVMRTGYRGGRQNPQVPHLVIYSHSKSHFIFFSVSGIKPCTLHMLEKCCATELHLQPFLFFETRSHQVTLADFKLAILLP